MDNHSNNMPSPSDGNEQQVRKKPIYKKWWFWVIIVLLFIGFPTSVFDLVSDILNPELVTNGESSQKNTKSKYSLCETVIVGDLECMITDVYDTNYIGGKYSGEPTAYNYAIVTMRIKNNSTKEIRVSDSNFYYYRGSDRYGSNSVGYYLENGLFYSESIGAKMSITLQVVYEIPSAHKTTDYILLRDSFQSAKVYLK